MFVTQINSFTNIILSCLENCFNTANRLIWEVSPSCRYSCRTCDTIDLLIPSKPAGLGFNLFRLADPNDLSSNGHQLSSKTESYRGEIKPRVRRCRLLWSLRRQHQSSWGSSHNFIDVPEFLVWMSRALGLYLSEEWRSSFTDTGTASLGNISQTIIGPHRMRAIYQSGVAHAKNQEEYLSL